MGLAVTSRKYDLAAALPFNPSDIINLQPVVKHSIPVCSVAKDLVETGKIQLAEVWAKWDPQLNIKLFINCFSVNSKFVLWILVVNL